MLAKLNTMAQRNSFALFIVALYGVELLDELIYGLEGAVLPTLKNELALTYTQVGLLFTVPGLVSLAGEPIIGLLGDTRHRRLLVLGGLAATVVGLLLIATGQAFGVILLAFSIMGTASGAYVNLAQGTLIDLNPARAENTMARWTALGAIGVTVSPLAATAAFYFGYGWRGLYFALAAIAGLYLTVFLRQSFNAHAGANEEAVSPRKLLSAFWSAMCNPELLRWMVLTELADLMLDKFLEVVGLYFHDVVRVSLAAASSAVAVDTIVGLISTALLVPVLEKVRGLRLLRLSAVVALAAYTGFLLTPILWLKYILLGVISLSVAGWWPVLRAKCYEVLPGQSGLVLAATSVFGVWSMFVPFLIGRAADVFGLERAMWLLIVGPLSLIVGLPRGKQGRGGREASTRLSLNRH